MKGRYGLILLHTEMERGNKYDSEDDVAGESGRLEVEG